MYTAANNSSNTKLINPYFFNTNEKLGQGSFGTVYLGHDLEDASKIYAVKVIPVDLIKNDPELQENLLNEMRVMSLLNHVNIIHCYDVLSSKNNHYFIMEYCSGGTLSQYLKKKGQLSESEALKILIQILKGYYEMLKLGIVHRDLKPDNILLHNGIFKLADFGFAKCVENFSKDILKSLVGTPLYMSPQILQQQEYSTKTDLWSIALIYYEMLFGKTPWQAKTHFELVHKILTESIKFPPETRISEDSKNFIIRALKIDENKRLSWEDVFCHSLFSDCFDYKRRKNELYKQAQNYQALLKTQIIEMNIDLYKLFNMIDKNRNSQLEMDEFIVLMKKLDKNVSHEQIEFVFNTIDEDGNNVISLYEFRKWLSNDQTDNYVPQKKTNQVIYQRAVTQNYQDNDNYNNNYNNHYFRNQNQNPKNYNQKTIPNAYYDTSKSVFNPPLLPLLPLGLNVPPVPPLNASGPLNYQYNHHYYPVIQPPLIPPMPFGRPFGLSNAQQGPLGYGNGGSHGFVHYKY